MIHKQKEMILSPYSALYDMVIPKDHIFEKSMTSLISPLSTMNC
jgi:hypothetical protein